MVVVTMMTRVHTIQTMILMAMGFVSLSQVMILA